MLYRRFYKAPGPVALPNLMSRRGEGCSLDRVQKVYAAGGILGARPLTQFQLCIGSESSVSSRFFKETVPALSGLALLVPAFPGPGRRAWALRV